MTGSPGIDQTAALGTVSDFLKEQQENLQKGVQPVVPDFPLNSTGHTKKYHYVDAKRINDGLVKEKDVNFFGVISDWEEPRRTRGPDMIESLKLVDPTGSIEARIFAKDMDGLPKPRKPGDIIRLHRVLVASYRNQAGDVSYSLVASTTKMRSSWALFDAEVVNEKDKYTPYNHSHDHFNMSRFCMRIIDVSRVVSSTGIWKKDRATALQQTNDTWRRQIKSALVSNGPNFWDLIALVVAVEKDDYHDQLNQTIVWVWDGTNAPAYPPSSDTRGLEKPHTEEELKRMSLSERAIVTTMNNMMRLKLDMSLVKSCPPPFGSIIPVRFKQPLTHDPEVGSWIRIRNCGFVLVQGQLQGYFTHATKWAVWRVADDIMLQSCLEEPYGLSDGCKDIDCGVIHSEILNNIRPITTIRDVLWRAHDLMNAGLDQDPDCEYFRCRARVMEIWPSQDTLQNICLHRSLVDDHVDPCDVDDEDEWVFAVRLTLEDTTGSMEADLFGRDAAYFFSDIVSPQNFNHPDNKQDLERLRNAFIDLQNPTEENAQTGIWIDVCIAMYWPENSNTAHYRIFDTKLNPM
jgi:hypothetical protein